MTSGRKAIRENTRERVISTDINRLQAFVAAYANEAMREQMLAPQDDSLAVGTTFSSAGALTSSVDITTPSAPLYGGVLNGLMLVVPLGVTYLLITPGMLLAVDPDGLAGSSNPNPTNPDDLGPAKLVYSAGVQSVGSLVWTPNPGPGMRIDVVECQRTDLVTETDNRDIFNPSTGMFVPAGVTKVTAGELTFRVRQGTAGSGLPAPALGWFPIAVISAPAGAVNLDACAIWDVRNLLSDLATPYANVRSVFPRIERFGVVCNRQAVPGDLQLSGEAVGTYNGWKIGGLFAQSFVVPYTDLMNVNFAWSAGFAPAAGSIYYVYALWPLGYVRWVRYSDVAIPGVGGRGPGPFRGVLTVSHVTPYNGQPLAPIAMPAGWGLGVSTMLGQALVAGTVDATGTMLGFIGDGDMIRHELDVVNVWRANFGAITTVGTQSTIDFTFTPGLDFPWGTKRVRFRLGLLLHGPAAGDKYSVAQSFEVLDTATLNQIANIDLQQLAFNSTGGVESQGWTLDVPVAADGISAPGALTYRWVWNALPSGTAGAITVTAGVAIVTGWDE